MKSLMKALRGYSPLSPSVIIGWTMFGLAYTLNYYFYANHYVEIFTPPPTLGEMLIWELPYWLLWAALSPLVLRFTQRFPLERGGLLRNSLVHVAACIALALVHRAVYLLIGWGLHVANYRRLASLYTVYDKNFLFNLPNGFLCYAMILLVGYVIGYYRRHQEEELKISRLKTELAQAQLQLTQAELQALKSQLQPHFLFNTLNSISSLMDEDVEAAEKMLARLGDFLRMTVDNSGAQEVELQEEVKFLRCYLEIEGVRFSDRLTVRVEIAPETHEALVPNLILQPIVENAILHGIMGQVGSGRIEIHSRRENDWLRLEVKDNGPGLHAEGDADQKAGRGLGFALTRARLERLYAARQRFLLSNAPEGGLQVIIEIPYRISSAATTEESTLIEERIAPV